MKRALDPMWMLRKGLWVMPGMCIELGPKPRTDVVRTEPWKSHSSVPLLPSFYSVLKDGLPSFPFACLYMPEWNEEEILVLFSVSAGFCKRRVVLCYRGVRRCYWSISRGTWPAPSRSARSWTSHRSITSSWWDATAATSNTSCSARALKFTSPIPTAHRRNPAYTCRETSTRCVSPDSIWW